MKEKDTYRLQQSYLALPEFFYSETEAQKGRNSELVLFNDRLASDLHLQPEWAKENYAMFAGDTSLTGVPSIAQGYAGHQFGNFTKLGDGRAILLGEQLTREGKLFDIQLKGSGPTVYSRGGDGLASVGPMLREYVISEAMHGLGIPTTRSLAVVTTDEPVYRETVLQRAILTRVASSHIRVGTFQYAAALGSKEDLIALTDYTIERHDRELAHMKDKYSRFLENVLHRQAKLIAKWQAVGFVHGVMNTDNMTISGETIDYGPCAFIDRYDPKMVFSSIDREGRYAYGNQPYIGAWNLTRFAEALLPILGDSEEEAIAHAQKILGMYEAVFQRYYEAEMRGKLGLLTVEERDASLIKELLDLLEKYKTDYTEFFRQLTLNEKTDIHDKADFNVWYATWKERQAAEKFDSKQIKSHMRAHNPAIIPRNYFVEEALTEAVEDKKYTKTEQLIGALKNPYAYSKEQEAYQNVPLQNKAYQTFCGT